ncbi:TauD/TfdA family dioxygenase [soil metagenome]
MSEVSFAVTQVSPRIGATIEGIDLSRPLAGSDVVVLRRAIATHQVLFFRNQQLDPVALERVGLYFGRLQPVARGGLPGHPEVMALLSSRSSIPASADEWHSDGSYEAVPPSESLLYLDSLPALGGETSFASMYAAYDALSSGMKVFLEGLTASHDRRVDFGRYDAKFPSNIVVHPVIRRHPVTGRKAIYVNRGFTSHINDLPEAESRALLDFLFEHGKNPYFQVKFRWEPGSLAIWDNRCTLHMAIWDFHSGGCSGLRLQVGSDEIRLAA